MTQKTGFAIILAVIFGAILCLYGSVKLANIGELTEPFDDE